MTEGYNQFESQLSNVVKCFPNLRIKTKEGKQYLKGTLDIFNTEQEFVQSFLIEIHWAKGFPSRFPALFEVGDSIPCGPDWHKYENNSCCITVEPSEILQCKNGITVSQFISKHVIPYLANQCYKMIEGKYMNEYPHGLKGLNVFYTDLMGTADTSKWSKYINYAFGASPLNIGRNLPCICGSGKKFKVCHNIVFDKIRQIGIVQILNDMKKINK